MGSHVAREKREVLRKLLKAENLKNAIIFCNRKRDVGIVYRSLERHGFNAGQLHGDMVQSARMEVLSKFKNGELTILVCSDVAARGLDIKEMSHVFNFDVPTHAEDYVHRIGRTGRAGNQGTAYTLATRDDAKYLDAIKRTIGKPIPEVKGEGAASKDEPTPDKGEEKPQRGRGRGRDRSEERKERPQREERQEKPKRDRNKGRHRRDEEDNEPDVPVKGMGDHVPAFMMRSAIEEPKKKPTKKAAKKPAAKKKAPAKKKAAEKEIAKEDTGETKKKTTRRRTTKKAKESPKAAETPQPVDEQPAAAPEDASQEA